MSLGLVLPYGNPELEGASIGLCRGREHFHSYNNADPVSGGSPGSTVSWDWPLGGIEKSLLSSLLVPSAQSANSGRDFFF